MRRAVIVPRPCFCCMTHARAARRPVRKLRPILWSSRPPRRETDARQPQRLLDADTNVQLTGMREGRQGSAGRGIVLADPGSEVSAAAQILTCQADMGGRFEHVLRTL
jgi:hypothetical protein